MTLDNEPHDNVSPGSSAQQNSAYGSLREAFPGQFRPTPVEFEHLWEDGLFVLDTNVLLNLYRYSHSTRDELLKVLNVLTEKLFVPHQIGEEFLDRRLSTIRTQREGFSTLRARVTNIRSEIETDLRDVLRLRSGEELPDGLRDALEEVPAEGYETLSERLEALEMDLPRSSNSPDDDEVWAAVELLVDGKLGRAYREEDLREVEEEAELRRKANIPPGFKDKRPGDYILWRQTLDEAKRMKKPVVLVTDDRKEDWWWKVRGETLGPHPALVAELRREVGMPFYMYTPERLMTEARDRLNVDVSDESISEAEGLGRDSVDTGLDVLSEWKDHYVEALMSNQRLSDSERYALSERYREGRSIESIAEELGIDNAAVERLLKITRNKLNSDLADEPSAPHRYESDLQKLNDFLWHGNRPVKRSGTFVNDVYIRVQGDEDSIVDFNRRLLNRFPEIETIDRRPADDEFSDAALRLRFRQAVPIEQAIRAVEKTAKATGVNIAMLTYSHFLP